MKDKPQILFLAHRIPYPPNKGDKIRSWRLLCHLAEKYDVHLGCFVDDKDDWQYTEKVASICKSTKFLPINPLVAKIKSAKGLLTGAPLSMAYYDIGALQTWVEEVRKNSLAAEFVFSSSMTQFIESEANGCPRFVDLCDADSEKWVQYADQSKGLMRWVYAREGRTLARIEREIVDWATASFLISADECSVIEGNHENLHWFGNGVDYDFFDPALPFDTLSRPADVVFVGAMDYRANVDAAIWFRKECWPLVKANCPEASLAIVGSNPSDAVRQIGGSDDVVVTGRVEDVRPWLSEASVVIAPMRVARGVQNKVLEAMAMQKTVVATSAAAEGIECNAGKDIVIADGAETFANSVSILLEEQHRTFLIGQRAREKILNTYTWENQLARLDDVMAAHLKSN